MPGIRNAEFKARVDDIGLLEQNLLGLSPKFIGEDHQKDTYYQVACGRLKLREGNIEQALIWYSRENIQGIKHSDILLYSHYTDKNLGLILEKANGIKKIVDKIRRIYFIGNVKFHFDRVKNLGDFIEVEVIDNTGLIEQKDLVELAGKYAAFFNIQPDQFIASSYSEMI